MRLPESSIFLEDALKTDIEIVGYQLHSKLPSSNSTAIVCAEMKEMGNLHDSLLDGFITAHLHAFASFNSLFGKEARKPLLKILGIPKILGSSLFESQIFRLNC